MSDFFKKLLEIKEGFEAFELLEQYRLKFQQLQDEYQKEIKTSKSKLAEIRLKIKELNNEKNEISNKKADLELEIEALKTSKAKAKVNLSLQQISQEAQEIKLSHDEITPNSLKKVEVFLNDGSSASLRPLRCVYDESLYQKYRVLLRENKEAKHKIKTLLLENRQLKIELRDYFSEFDLYKKQNQEVSSILSEKKPK